MRAPRANAVTERAIGTLRHECLDYVIPLDEAHLRGILAEYADYDNRDWPHRTLGLETPRPRERPRAVPAHRSRRYVRPILGGLYHVYGPAAA